MHDVAEHQYTEEDEINLLDLLMVLIRHKLLIICLVFFAGAAAVGISLYMINIYRSEAVITIKTEEKTAASSLSALGGLGGFVADEFGLGGSSLEKIEAVLKSRDLKNRLIKEYDLMPILFSDIWNGDKKIWESDKPPTTQDGWKVMEGALTVNLDIKKNMITVGYDHQDPETAQKIVDYYLTELSEVLREEVLQDAAENMRFFRAQLEKTVDTFLREKIYTMLAREIEKETFARAQKYYSFLVLDPPFVPDQDKKIRPKRALICILSVITAFFFAVFLAFIKEYIHRLKTEDPDRYQNLARGLRLRKKKAGRLGSQEAGEEGGQT